MTGDPYSITTSGRAGRLETQFGNLSETCQYLSEIFGRALPAPMPLIVGSTQPGQGIPSGHIGEIYRRSRHEIFTLEPQLPEPRIEIRRQRRPSRRRLMQRTPGNPRPLTTSEPAVLTLRHHHPRCRDAEGRPHRDLAALTRRTSPRCAMWSDLGDTTLPGHSAPAPPSHGAGLPTNPVIETGSC